MADTMRYGVLVVSGGRAAEGAVLHESKEEALACVQQVLAGLGVAGGAWVRVAPGVAVLAGSEGGGWGVVLWRGLAPEGEAGAARARAARARKRAAARPQPPAPAPPA